MHTPTMSFNHSHASGNRSWAVTVNSKTLFATFRLQLWPYFMPFSHYTVRWLPAL